ncbi:hypothetical protein [Crenothrix polyspora]|uniref:Chromosome segregation ATPase-like protein n=1 Tax=Crenothrix polyspora TaxID=360316 RepID=A0A1R4GYV8_9GAMM|nr:hypothetical protein [Crenothrix polyspora]SJM88990.1 hypothetical protein CRENPOLYSF1_10018 [Crenothrix polyspora]
MNTVILTGSPWIDSGQLFPNLQKLGIKNALSTENNTDLTIGSWHDKIFSGKRSHEYRQVQLGKAWEQSVSEIFMANWGQEPWGWADSRSLWLLDFWRDFDPEICFILVHVSPEQALAQAISQIDEQIPFSLDNTIATWLVYERELLRFYLRNQQRCLLVDLERINNDPALLIETASRLFSLELDDSAIDPESQAQPAAFFNPLASLLAKQALQRFPEALGLWEEIKVSLTVLPTVERSNSYDQIMQIPDAITELRSVMQGAELALEAMSKARDEQLTQVFVCNAQMEQQEIEFQARIKQNELQFLHQQKIQETHQEALLVKNNSLKNDLNTLSVNLIKEKNLAKESQTLINQLSSERDNQARIAAERQQHIEQLVQERDAQSDKVENCQAQINQLEQQRDNHVKIATDVRQENELILLQLHQVQEELEQYFLKNLTLENELKANDANLTNERKLAEERQQHINQLGGERDNQARIATERQQQIEQLVRERDAQSQLAENRQVQINQLGGELNSQARIAAERQQQIEHLAQERNVQSQLAENRQVQINQLGGELNSQARIAAERQQQVEQLVQERDAQSQLAENCQVQINQLGGELDSQARIAAERQQQLEQLVQERNTQNQLVENRQAHINQLEQERDSYIRITTDVRQENELLLLQLHQVQEELEYYFLQHLQEQKLREQTNQRLTRVLGRWPNFVDMAGLQIVPAFGKELQEIVLTATDVYHASRHIEQYSLRVQVKDENAAIIIERPDVQLPNPLLRWPVESADETTLVIPVKPTKAVSGLAHLSTSDWQFLQALSQTLGHALQQGDFQLSEDNRKFNPAIWQQALTQLSQALQEDSDCLRYDQVRLKREQVNPDYEHLWLHVSNLHYKGKQWPSIEFRLSAALVKKKGFSSHPKLEFPQPETGLPLFENWQPDIEDDYGLKMELRCEIKTQAIDIHFWNSLSAADQSLLLALISYLPLFLADLEMQKIAINRSWQDWQSLVQGTIATINARSIELGIESSCDIEVIAA